MKLLLDTHILLWSLLEPTRLTRDVAVELESRYQDPADRFLVGTALVYGLTLVTADPRIVLSKVIPVLPNKISSGVL